MPEMCGYVALRRCCDQPNEQDRVAPRSATSSAVADAFGRISASGQLWEVLDRKCGLISQGKGPIAAP
jgi:hypothetical protein